MYTLKRSQTLSEWMFAYAIQMGQTTTRITLVDGLTLIQPQKWTKTLHLCIPWKAGEKSSLICMNVCLCHTNWADDSKNKPSGWPNIHSTSGMDRFSVIVVSVFVKFGGLTTIDCIIKMLLHFFWAVNVWQGKQNGFRVIVNHCR